MLISRKSISMVNGGTYLDDPTMPDLLSWAAALDGPSDHTTPTRR